MSEQNKALVREIYESLWNKDLSILEKHPGMQEIIPFLEKSAEIVDNSSSTIHEQVAEGDWVITRTTTESTLKQDYMGVTAGTTVKTEVIAMHKIVDGIIVKQHSQGNRVDM